MKKTKILIYAIITIFGIIFTSCDKPNNISINNNRINKEKTFIDYSKYEQMGLRHNQCLDTIKNDKDFFLIKDNPNILDEIFIRHFKLNYLFAINFTFDSLNHNISDYANFMYNSRKISESEYDFCLFVNDFSIDFNDSLDDELVLQEIQKKIKNYIDTICKKEIKETDLDNILAGCFVFLYSTDYWYRELKNENSNWSKLFLSSNQSKYLDYASAGLAAAKADAIARSNCREEVNDKYGYDLNYEQWNAEYPRCDTIAAIKSAIVFVKEIFDL